MNYEEIKKELITNIDGMGNLFNFLEKQTDWLIAPASSKLEYHSCRDGGLIEHSVNVCNNILKLKNTMADDIPDIICLLVGLFHDIHKINTYIKTTESWKINKGWIYEYKTAQTYLGLAGDTLFLLLNFIKLTPDMIQAILYHDGQYVDRNKEIAHKEGRLTLLLHYADYWSCHIEKI